MDGQRGFRRRLIDLGWSAHLFAVWADDGERLSSSGTIRTNLCRRGDAFAYTAATRRGLPSSNQSRAASDHAS